MPANGLERTISAIKTESNSLTKDPQHSNGDHKLNQNVRKGWNIKASKISTKTHNRIRAIVESLKIQPNPDKPMIPLSIGEQIFFKIKCFSKLHRMRVLGTLEIKISNKKFQNLKYTKKKKK